MRAYALVFLGAGLGGALRHGANVICARLLGTGFPWSTLVVNVLGSLVMGVLAGGLLWRLGGGAELRLLLATGVLGGFTTFSALSLDLWSLGQRGEAGPALAYALGSVGLSLGALALGLAAGRALA